MLQISFSAVTVIAISFLFLSSSTSNAFMSSWPRAFSRLTNNTGPYQAPLICDGIPDWLVPGAYIVYLHDGCSLAQHKRTVADQVDLDSCIRSIYPEIDGLGVVYSAYFSDSALAAVRSDWMVDMVECQYEGRLDV